MFLGFVCIANKENHYGLITSELFSLDRSD